MLRQTVIIIILIQLFPDVALSQKQEVYQNNYTLLNDKQRIEIPFEFYGMNIMVRAKMNGINVNLLIDNGVMWDEAWFYGNEQVDSLGFTYEDGVTIQGAGEGEGVVSKTANCPDIVFDGIIFKNQRAIVSDKEEGFADFFPGMAGQICGTLFKNFMVEFNFDTQMIILHDPREFNYKGKGMALDMQHHPSESYSIPLKIVTDKKVIDINVFIDLGGVYPLSLVLNDDIKVEDDAEKIVLGYGASGEIRGYHGQVKEVKLGKHTLNDVPTVFIEDETGGDHTNITVGLPLFMKFNLVFDYFNNRLYIEPNQHFNKPFDKP
jgi:hypothetical protein